MVEKIGKHYCCYCSNTDFFTEQILNQKHEKITFNNTCFTHAVACDTLPISDRIESEIKRTA